MGDGPRSDPDIVGEATRIEQVFFERLTEGLVLLETELATAARDMVRNDDAVADFGLIDIVAQFDDLADELVPEDDALVDGAVTVLEEIGAAEPATRHPDEDLSAFR